MAKIIIRDFIEFLEENNALEQYKANNQNCEESISEGENEMYLFLNKYAGTPTRWIGNAFIWDNTPEGQDFWNELDRQWFERIKDEYE